MRPRETDTVAESETSAEAEAKSRVRGFNLALMLYAGFLPFESIAIAGGGLARAWGLAVVGLGVLSLKHARTVPMRTVSVLAAAPVLALFSYWWSFDPGATATRFGTYASLAVVALLVVALGDRRTVMAALRGLGVGSLLAAGFVMQDYGNQLASEGLEIRSTAASANANDLAATLAVAATLALAIVIYGEPRWERLFFLGVFLASGYGTILTASRTATVGLICGIVIILLWGVKRLFRRALVFAVALVALNYVLTSVDVRILERLLGAASAAEQGDLNYRNVIWGQALDAWTERPLFGWGAGTFVDVMANLTGRQSAAHNSLLGVLVELGLVGAMGLVVVVVMAVRRVWRIEPGDLRVAFAAGGFVLIVNMALLSWDYRKIPWLILALILIPNGEDRRPGAVDVRAPWAARTTVE